MQSCTYMIIDSNPSAVALALGQYAHVQIHSAYCNAYALSCTSAGQMWAANVNSGFYGNDDRLGKAIAKIVDDTVEDYHRKKDYV